MVTLVAPHCGVKIINIVEHSPRKTGRLDMPVHIPPYRLYSFLKLSQFGVHQKVSFRSSLPFNPTIFGNRSVRRLAGVACIFCSDDHIPSRSRSQFGSHSKVSFYSDYYWQPQCQVHPGPTDRTEIPQSFLALFFEMKIKNVALLHLHRRIHPASFSAFTSSA